MNRRYSSRYRASSWLVGIIVLIALGTAVAWMINKGDRFQPSADSSSAAQVGGASARAAELPKLMETVAAAERSAGVTVRGMVVTPRGEPAASATVTLYRLRTGWPEWQRVWVREAITHADGRFQIRCPHYHGYLLRYEHPQYAGGEVEVSVLGNDMRLQLQPGFDISGFVLNDVGAPVPNARVSVESVLGEQRRARSVRTSADGRYRFTRLAAGPAQLVARHESWQPARAAALVIGDRAQADFRFDRPSMSPLRGRVLSATTQKPIAGAKVQLVSVSDSIGLADPIATTTAADGTFLLGGLPRGSMRLWVRHPDYGIDRSTQSIRAAGNDVTIDLPDRTKVRGLLETKDEGVFAGGEVLMMRDAGHEVQFTQVGKDGSFEFEELASPGTAEFRVVGGAFAFRSLKGTVWNKVLSESSVNDLDISVIKAATVRGRFIDADGKPVTGVHLARTHLLSDTVAMLGSGAWNLDLSKVGDGLVQLVDVVRDEPLAISNDEGSFEIRGFRRGLLVARVSCPGRGSRWLHMQVPMPGEVADLGDVNLAAGCSISGRVLRGGLPFVGATVTVVSPDCQSMTTTDARGNYVIQDLEPGRYEVKGRLSDRPTGNNVRVVQVTSEAPARNVNISLDIGRVLRGVVQNEDGDPLKDALVSIRGRPGQVISTKQSGRFDLELPSRNVELVVSFGDRTKQKIVPVAADQEELTVRLQTPPTSTLVATVAGLPGRRVVPGVLLRLTSLDRPEAEVRTRWVDTLGGEFRKPQVESGRVRIEIWCDGFAPFQTERVLKPFEQHDLGEVLLAPGAALRGVVRDADGNPVAGAMVLLGEETDFDLFVPSVRSDAEGVFTINGVTSRSKHLVVRSPGFAANSFDLLLPQDVLRVEPLPITLERGATIEVLVLADQIPVDRVVFLRRGNRLLGSTVLDDRGRAWFANRSAGTYRVTLFGSGLPEQRVEVKPGDEVSSVRFDDRRK